MELKPPVHNRISIQFILFALFSVFSGFALVKSGQIFFLFLLVGCLWLVNVLGKSYRINGSCIESRNFFWGPWRTIVCSEQVESHYQRRVKEIEVFHFFLEGERMVLLEAANKSVEVLLKEFSNSCPQTSISTIAPDWFQSKMKHSYLRGAIYLLALSIFFFVLGYTSEDDRNRIAVPIFGLIALILGLILLVPTLRRR